MTITSKFFTGYVNNIDWANGIRAARSRYMVNGTGDFKVSTNGAVARGYSVAAGTASGGGILTTSDAVESGAGYALPFNAAERWHLIGISRVWGGTNTSVITSIIGSASKAIPTRPTTPGVDDFQPLALARVAAGGASIAELVDLRAVGGGDGQLSVFDAMAKDYLTLVGMRLHHERAWADGGPILYERIVGTGGSATWRETLVGDTGWVSVGDALPSPWISDLLVRRRGDTVELDGTFDPNGTVWGAINNPQDLVATGGVPAHFRPNRTRIYTMGSDNPNSAGIQFRVNVQSDGGIVGRCNATNYQFGVRVHCTYLVN